MENECHEPKKVKLKEWQDNIVETWFCIQRGGRGYDGFLTHRHFSICLRFVYGCHEYIKINLSSPVLPPFCWLYHCHHRRGELKNAMWTFQYSPPFLVTFLRSYIMSFLFYQQQVPSLLFSIFLLNLFLMLPRVFCFSNDSGFYNLLQKSWRFLLASYCTICLQIIDT